MAANDYHFVTRWRVQGSTTAVYELVVDAQSYLRWWPQVYLEVTTVTPGGEHGFGAVHNLHTRGKLPYTLRWQARVTETRYPRGFTVEATGDFLGRGVWTFEQGEGGVNITFDWRLRAEKPLLRHLSFLFKLLFQANHRWAMARGEVGLRKELAGRYPVKTEPSNGSLAGYLLKRLSLLSVNVAGAIALLVSTLLVKLRLRREPDPWRRTVGVGLRSEASKFALTTFGLRALSPWTGENLSAAGQEQRFVARLAAFLQGEPDARFTLRHGRFCSYRVKNPYLDVTLARFSPGGALLSIWPFLDERYPVALDLPQRLKAERTIVEEYNRTRRLPERRRPETLLHRLKRRWFKGGTLRPVRARAAPYGERILKGCCVSFEAARTDDPLIRFVPPDFRFRRVIGSGFLNFVCRKVPGGAMDVWMQVHHTGADGLPMQELLTRLENAWGTDGSVLFPADAGNLPELQPCAAPQERPLYLLTDFLDFSPLLALRYELKKRLVQDGIEKVPLGALFLWCLAHQPEFEGVRFANAVEVPADETRGRAVDLVPICPADYLNTGRSGFVAFLRDFNQLVADARHRRTSSCQAMRKLALLPPALAAAALRLNPAAARSTFGTLGVSMVKDAKVTVGTMADQGFDGGFMVIGNTCLPCANGRTAAAVSIKGDYAAIRHYPPAIRRALQMAGTCFDLSSQW